jgi:hypothetical protein
MMILMAWTLHGAEVPVSLSPMSQLKMLKTVMFSNTLGILEGETIKS